MNTKTVRFSRKDPAHFFKTLNKRVNDYFKENQIKKNRQLALTLEDHNHVCPISHPLFLNLNTRFTDLGQSNAYYSNGRRHGRCRHECYA